MSNLQQGLIVRSTGSWYEVELSDGTVLPCRMKGKLRLNDLKVTNPVAVGDNVMIELEADSNNGIIKEVIDRRNYVIRQSPRKKHYLHILAANIDQAVLIVTMVTPSLKQGFIDRFLLMTEPYNIPVHIFFNKGDLYTNKDIDNYLSLKDVYEKIGYHCYMVSALEGKGIQTINEVLRGKTTLMSGQSGVGKSSLINLIAPDLELRIGDISDYTGKGQHTTTFAEMFDLGESTKIIDSPGIKSLSYNYLEPLDIAHNFREFFEASSGCKYDNCMHKKEPKCAVKDGVEDGSISPLRYQNYLQILEEIDDQNYWERNV